MDSLEDALETYQAVEKKPEPRNRDTAYFRHHKFRVRRHRQRLEDVLGRGRKPLYSCLKRQSRFKAKERSELSGMEKEISDFFNENLG